MGTLKTRTISLTDHLHAVVKQNYRGPMDLNASIIRGVFKIPLATKYSTS